jgi:hypothetical protein
MIKGVLSFWCVAFLLFAVTGCDEPRYKIELRYFAEDAKKTINATDLQNWAVEFLKTNSDYGLLNDGLIPSNMIPLNVRNLNSQGAPLEFASVDKDNICLTWGGGFGHWGICVGSQTFKLHNFSNSYNIKWQPGIYFFTGP